MQSRRWRSRQQIAKDLLPRHLALSVDFIALESLRMYIYNCPNAGGDPVRRSCARKQTARLVLELQIYLWRGHLCLRLRCDVFSGAGRMCFQGINVMQLHCVIMWPYLVTSTLCTFWMNELPIRQKQIKLKCERWFRTIGRIWLTVKCFLI